jgi:hypothetical protein
MPLMAHAEMVDDVERTAGADPRKYASYLASRPRKWEQASRAPTARARPRTPRLLPSQCPVYHYRKLVY